MSREPISQAIEELLSGVRFGQFVSVGATGAVVDTTTTVLLTTRVGLHPGASKLIGAELAIVLMFLINDRWTFAEAGHVGLGPKVRRFLKSNLVRAGGVGVATVVFVILAGLEVALPVGGRELWLVGANAAGIAAGMVVNYVAESLFTWRLASQ
jgi:putative flippase GtrA